MLNDDGQRKVTLIHPRISTLILNRCKHDELLELQSMAILHNDVVFRKRLKGNTTID